MGLENFIKRLTTGSRDVTEEGPYGVDYEKLEEARSRKKPQHLRDVHTPGNEVLSRLEERGIVTEQNGFVRNIRVEVNPDLDQGGIKTSIGTKPFDRTRTHMLYQAQANDMDFDAKNRELETLREMSLNGQLNGNDRQVKELRKRLRTLEDWATNQCGGCF